MFGRSALCLCQGLFYLSEIHINKEFYKQYYSILPFSGFALLPGQQIGYLASKSSSPTKGHFWTCGVTWSTLNYSPVQQKLDIFL